MYIYICLAAFYLSCMIIDKVLNKRINRKIFIILLALPLFILSAFRAPSVGNDTYNYYRSYMIVSDEAFFSISQSRFEIGYIFYMRLIALFGIGYLGFQIITSTFILFSLSKFLNKYSNNIALSFFIFLSSRMFFGSMNVTRQYLAISILLFSLDFIKQRKLFKFLMVVIIASTIHFTAIIFVVVYPLSKFNLNKSNTFLLISAGIVVSFLFDKIIRIFIYITGRYSGYLSSGYFNFEDNIAIYLNLSINLLFFLVAFYTKYWKVGEHQVSNKDVGANLVTLYHVSNEKLWYIFCLLTLILSIIGLNATIITRIESYFSFFFLAYIPSVIRCIKNKVLRAIVFIGIILGLFASFVVVMVYRPYWTTVFPYEWYWNFKMPN